MALIQTLTDNFDDNSTDVSKWNSFNSPSETGGQLQVTSNLASIYKGYDSVTTYDLTASSAYIQLVDAGNQALTHWEVYPLVLRLDVNNYLYILVENNTIHFAKKVATVNTNIINATYNSTTHAWVRIRESGGTIFYDSSTDGSSWTNRASTSVASSFAVTALTLEIQAGTWGAEASTTTAKFDNLNTLGATTKQFSTLGVG